MAAVDTGCRWGLGGGESNCSKLVMGPAMLVHSGRPADRSVTDCSRCDGGDASTAAPSPTPAADARPAYHAGELGLKRHGSAAVPNRSVRCRFLVGVNQAAADHVCWLRR
jgi:hypothetical protein